MEFTELLEGPALAKLSVSNVAAVAKSGGPGAVVARAGPSAGCLCPPTGFGLLLLALVVLRYKSRNTHHFKAAVPSLFGTRDQFCGRRFSHGPERAGMVLEDDFLMDQSGLGWFWKTIFSWTRAGWDGFGIQAHYVYCALDSIIVTSASTSDPQALDPGGLGPLL